ncbi:RpiB/LacA/LacB family sugar-phosphate isomerase [Anaerolentibacter hominis]|uniref:RpiB/LacA/LacB family sugar-phosphate isomerase n=1 Tax=Anaerolentibacter hominis TaxID=3079009 RepID=UPI0031B83F20
MRIAIASDRIGYVMKETIKNHLDEKNIDYYDFGCYELERCGYTEKTVKVCEAIEAGEFDRGILIDSNGVGVCIAANRYAQIYAATVGEIYSARMTRRHNNANVLCFGARITGPAVVLEAVDTWLDTPFDGGSHVLLQQQIEKVRQEFLSAGGREEGETE